jgi:hypothetical protein
MPDNRGDYQRDFNDNMLEWRGEMKTVVKYLHTRVSKLEDTMGPKFWLKIISVITLLLGLAAALSDRIF